MRGRYVISLCAVVISAACAPDSVNAPLVTAPSATLGSIKVSPGAAVLAVGQTQQLTVKALSLTGTPITTLDSVRYLYKTLSDTSRVQISANGVATALSVTTQDVFVTVLAYQGAAIRADHLLLKVTASAVPGLQLVLQPNTTTLAQGTVGTITPTLLNPTTSATVTSPVIRYSVGAQDQQRMGVYAPVLFITTATGFVTIRPSPYVFPASTLTQNQVLALTGEGTAWVYADLTAYGTAMHDSVLYTFTYPKSATISTVKSNLAVTSTYASQSLVVAPGATVTFNNGSAATDPLTIAYTFDNPSAATAATPPSSVGGSTGNISALIGGQSSARTFATAGTYHWTATASGGPAPWAGQVITGTIVVK